MLTLKTRPVKTIRTGNYETKKSTQSAKLETLRRKTVRNLKNGNAPTSRKTSQQGKI